MELLLLLLALCPAGGRAKLFLIDTKDEKTARVPLPQKGYGEDYGLFEDLLKGVSDAVEMIGPVAKQIDETGLDGLADAAKPFIDMFANLLAGAKADTADATDSKSKKTEASKKENKKVEATKVSSTKVESKKTVKTKADSKKEHTIKAATSKAPKAKKTVEEPPPEKDK